jgi:hypothetical protein
MCCGPVVAAQALLAGGTFNGELIIWDLNKDDASAQVCGTMLRCVVWGGGRGLYFAPERTQLFAVVQVRWRTVRWTVQHL